MQQFSPQQAVNLRFNDGNVIAARIIEKVDDATIRPLTGYWMVAVELEAGLGRPFGFSGSHIEPR